MALPEPSDPLDDHITLFTSEVRQFLDAKAEVSDLPAASESADPRAEIERLWKSLVGKAHDAMVQVQPALDLRLDRIIELGGLILALTDDVNIISRVERIVALVTDRRDFLKKIAPVVGNATTIPNTVLLFIIGLIFAAPVERQLNEIETSLDDLTAYYMLRGFPPNDAA